MVAALRERYAGRGVELAEVAGGLQFRTAPDLAPRLRRVVQVPRRLPRAAMETLAIIAYHQPVTRAEIEEIRGASLSQQTLDALLEQGLVAPQRAQGGAGPADAVGDHDGLPGAVRPEGSARTAAAGGSAGGAALAAAGGGRRRRQGTERIKVFASFKKQQALFFFEKEPKTFIVGRPMQSRGSAARFHISPVSC